jgi:hypothetical protein
MRPRFVWMLGMFAMGAAAWSGACTGTIATVGSGATTTSGTSVSGAAGSSAAGSGATAGTGAGSSSGSAGAGGGLASPPPPGPHHAPDGTGTTVFAVSQLDVGLTDPDGMSDEQNGWMHYGYNIDGLPAGDLSAFCMPLDGASAAEVHQHGIDGIENSFGHNIVPVFYGDPSGPIGPGQPPDHFTTLILLGDLGQGASYDPIPSSVAQGRMVGAAPMFDGTDVWPLVSGTRVGFASSYVVGDTWVSGASPESAAGPFVVQLLVSDFAVTLKILLPRLSMKLDPTHTKATSGIISGVLLTSDLEAEIQTIAGSFDPNLCSGPTIQSILQGIAQASDILHDGTQDPTKPCDAISIGLGFEAVREQLGPVVQPSPPPPDVCADGG